jgi:hypothetical protein
MQANFSSFSSSFTKIDLGSASFNEIVSVKLELSIRTVLETSNSDATVHEVALDHCCSFKLRWQLLHCVLKCNSQLKSGFLFLRGSPFSFPSPFVFADIALFQVSSNCDLLAPALGTSFFSNHLSYISLARASMISTAITDISFQVYIKGSRE